MDLPSQTTSEVKEHETDTPAARISLRYSWSLLLHELERRTELPEFMRPYVDDMRTDLLSSEEGDLTVSDEVMSGAHTALLSDISLTAHIASQGSARTSSAVHRALSLPSTIASKFTSETCTPDSRSLESWAIDILIKLEEINADLLPGISECLADVDAERTGEAPATADLLSAKDIDLGNTKTGSVGDAYKLGETCLFLQWILLTEGHDVCTLLHDVVSDLEKDFKVKRPLFYVLESLCGLEEKSSEAPELSAYCEWRDALDERARFFSGIEHHYDAYRTRVPTIDDNSERIYVFEDYVDIVHESGLVGLLGSLAYGISKKSPLRGGNFPLTRIESERRGRDLAAHLASEACKSVIRSMATKTRFMVNYPNFARWNGVLSSLIWAVLSATEHGPGPDDVGLLQALRVVVSLPEDDPQRQEEKVPP
jgi:hypothetical protein